MAFHHVALATRDLAATHRFYCEAMGFELVKTEVVPTGNPGGWARHVFYDTGGDGLMAFWEMNDEAYAEFDPAISTSQGLPEWVNHVAFHATTDTLGDCRDRWLAHGIDVIEVNHGFCVSIYARDPNGILVEWCADVRQLDDDDRREALALLTDPDPAMPAEPPIVIHEAAAYAAAH
jgi:catechol 2,3-dioxygenase-like lactoylglutathione lyase family enzyme